jgi:transposase-like protein
MKRTKELPQTLVEVIRYFSDLDVALAFMAILRWPDGPECPRCESKKYSFLSTRRVWKCKDCKKQYTVKQGSIMEDSPIALDKWLCAIWLIANCKNGISSYEVARDLGITQKSGWFLLSRIRLAMQTGTFRKLIGEVEADETFIGGLSRNMHASKREAKISGTGGRGKTAVLGMLERHGEVTAMVVPNVQRHTLQSEVRTNVESGTTLYTDKWVAYDGLDAEYVHQVINHAEQYVNGRIHTNGIENFWSLLKRSLKVTYVSVAPFHLFRYLDEQSFRFNQRKTTDFDRFLQVANAMAGKRLTYRELTGKNESDGESGTARGEESV